MSAERRPASAPSDPNARAVALEVIRAVTERGAYSTIATNAALRRSQLPRRDRDLATELAYGTIRRLIPLDSALRPHVPRGLERTRGRPLACLRLGAYQLLFTRIPAHAAVSETVGLARGRERGFVNAVLRRVSTDSIRFPEGGDDESLSVRTGLSAWAVSELRRVTHDVERAAEALAASAPLAVRVNGCRTSVEDVRTRLRDAGIGNEPHPLVPETLSLDGASSPRELPGFDQGWFTVQDAASAFVANALETRPGDRILDACAAPGGKATALACAVGPNGSLVAADVRERRLRLATAAAGRLGVRASFLVQDATRPALRGAFDRVLVDAPCSGDRRGAQETGAPLAPPPGGPLAARPPPGRDRARSRRAPRARRPPRLLRLYVPPSGDRRRGRRDPAALPVPRASGDPGAGRPGSQDPALAA